MIAKEEYLKALEVVEAYHKQIITESKEIGFSKTPLEDWQMFFKGFKFPGKVSHVFRDYNIHDLKTYQDIHYVEDLLNLNHWNLKHIGKKTKDQLKECLDIILSAVNNN